MTADQPGQESQAFQIDTSSQPVATVHAVQMNQQELDGDWSQLRQQSADNVIETERSTVAPRYRKQVENYFKILSQQRK